MRLILGLALALAPAAAGAATRSYTVTGFERVRILAPFAVSLRTGPGSAVKATGSADDLARVRIDVQGRTLVISAERDTAAWRRTGEPVTIAVTTPQLVAAQLSGAGTLAVDRVRGDRLDLSVGGAGDLRVETLDVAALGVTVLGAGDVTLAGKAARARIAVQGAGNVKAAALTVQDADVSVAGAGDVSLAATRTAKVASSGVGEVEIAGPARCSVTRTGMGEVTCGR